MLKKSYSDRGQKNKTLEGAFLPAKLYNAINTWVSSLEGDLFHPSQFGKTDELHYVLSSL